MDGDAWMLAAMISVLAPLVATVLLAVGGPTVFWLMIGLSALIAGWFAGGPAAAGPVLVGGYLFAQSRKRHRDLLARAQVIIDQHAAELAIRRTQLLRTGAYGVVDRKAWDAEIGRFIADVGSGRRRPLASR